MKSSHRSLCSQSCDSHSLQDGDSGVGQERGRDVLYHPQGRVLLGTHSPKLSTIHPDCLVKNRVYQFKELCFGLSTASRSSPKCCLWCQRRLTGKGFAFIGILTIGLSTQVQSFELWKIWSSFSVSAKTWGWLSAGRN